MPAPMSEVLTQARERNAPLFDALEDATIAYAEAHQRVERLRADLAQAKANALDVTQAANAAALTHQLPAAEAAREAAKAEAEQAHAAALPVFAAAQRDACSAARRDLDQHVQQRRQRVNAAQAALNDARDRVPPDELRAAGRVDVLTRMDPGSALIGAMRRRLAETTQEPR